MERPLGEAIPDAPRSFRAAGTLGFFMDEGTLLPGFCQADCRDECQRGENVFPRSSRRFFRLPSSRGKSSTTRCRCTPSIRRILPDLDDALADKIEPGTTADQLVQKVRERLENLAEAQFENAKRQAAVRYLLEKVDCELPAPVVQKEMDGILHDIVRENQVRGISDDEIRKHQNELIGAAQQGAKDRVRGNFLLLRIAEKENLKVTEEDLSRRVLEMAARYEIPVGKLVKDLQRRDGFGALREQILIGKALDLLAANVTVREPSGEPSA